jgi:hypothetical protein
MGRRGPAVVGALLCAALATAGCGLGPGEYTGDVPVTVTREFGAVPVREIIVSSHESDTVMRALEGVADVETRYGGGFVHSIDGVSEEQHDGDPYDWFFYVDGVESQIGAADYALEGEERVWWDYHDWGATNHIPAVVGSWPAPFRDGIGGKRYPVAVECMERLRGSFVRDNRTKEPRACAVTREALEREGARVVSGTPDDAIRVLVGPWARVRQDATARLIEEGPAESGVFADFKAGNSGYELVALDEGGADAEQLGPDAGLVAATSRYGGLPVWVVTGGTAKAVRRASALLDPNLLGQHFAVAIGSAPITIPLPLENP